MSSYYKNKKNDKKMAALLFLSPAIIFLFIFSIVPSLYTIYISFFRYNTAMPADSIKFIGFENYASILTDKEFLESISWTFTFTISAVVLNLLVGMTLAVILTADYWERLSKVFRVFFTMPMMIAPIVIATIWKLIFSPIYGVLNGILFTLGFERVNWLSETFTARIALIVVEVWATTPLCMLIFIAALKTVPDEILEAATIDGGSWAQKFKHIVLPHIRGFITLVITMRFMDSIRMFDIVYNLTNGGPGTSTETLASTIYKKAFRYYEVGEGSAGAVIFFILIVVFSLLFIKLFSEKEEKPKKEVAYEKK